MISLGWSTNKLKALTKDRKRATKGTMVKNTEYTTNQSLIKLRSKRSRQKTLNKPSEVLAKKFRQPQGSNKIPKAAQGYDLLEGEVTMLDTPNHMICDSINETPSHPHMFNSGAANEESKIMEFTTQDKPKKLKILKNTSEEEENIQTRVKRILPPIEKHGGTIEDNLNISM